MLRSDSVPPLRLAVDLPRISFGTGTSAGLFVSGDRDEQRTAARVAIDGHITHFDTAPIYGFGAAEVNLGAVLKEIRAEVLVTSKVNITAEFLQTRDIRTCIVRSVKASLARLQRDHLDFLLVHNPLHRGRSYRDPSDLRVGRMEFYPPLTLDDYLGFDGVHEAAGELRQAGLVRYIGLGGMDSTPDTLKSVFASGDVALFQQPYHLVNPTAALPLRVRNSGFTPTAFDTSSGAADYEDVLTSAQSHGVAGSIISPVAAGVLTDDAFEGRAAEAVSARGKRFPVPGQFEDLVARAHIFANIANEAGMSVTELAYRFVLSHPAATTVVGGFSNVDQVRQAITFNERGPLEPGILAAIENAWIQQSIGAHHE
jgi:aryl-alcohol dehydrogenase-like predicted oxidoreductase